MRHSALKVVAAAALYSRRLPVDFGVDRNSRLTTDAARQAINYV
jgi:hypothetical protein